MKRTLLAISFVCFVLSMAAQAEIRVKYQGARPTIKDFVTAFVAPVPTEDEEGEYDESMAAVRNAWEKYLKGKPQEEGWTLIVDEKNGYVSLEHKSTYESDEDLGRWEMCYWNEADGKHKLFAYNVLWFRNGKYSPGQYDGLTFWRYNNATKEMNIYSAPGFEAVYDSLGENTMISFALPRTGKDIIFSTWKNNEKKQQKALKWNGRKFSL